MKVYPNAKVILTMRDSGEIWYKSVRESIFNIIAINAGVNFIKVLQAAFMQANPKSAKLSIFLCFRDLRAQKLLVQH